MVNRLDRIASNEVSEGLLGKEYTATQADVDEAGFAELLDGALTNAESFREGCFTYEGW